YMRSSPAGAWVPNDDTLPWRGTAAGGGYSTVGDLLRFARGLSPGKFIPVGIPPAAPRQHRQQYGYGFAVEGQGPLQSHGHRGGAHGMNGQLRGFPRLGYVLVGLSNRPTQVPSP